MPSDAFDSALLSPVAAGHDELVSDAAVLEALVTAEAALVRAWAAAGALPASDAEQIVAAWGRGGTERSGVAGVDVAELAREAVAGGNPVIPLVQRLRRSVAPEHRTWVHRGATSQDVLDTAVMLLARRAVEQVARELETVDAALTALADRHRHVVAVGRTLGQHAVPVTVGLRAARWGSALRRARLRLRSLTLPAQLGGAAGTRAAFVELGGDRAEKLPARFAELLGLDDAGPVWHTDRWPVTELADALTGVTDALGKFGGDVVTLSRPELGELTFGQGGGSSAMPQKSNPVQAVLIRSAALRAPQLAATLHLCAALAEDERPAGAWHAEWPTLRELLRLALGAAAHAAALAGAVRVDTEAVTRNLRLSGGLVLAERLSVVLTPVIGADRVAAVVTEAAAGGDLRALLLALPEAAGLDIDDLLDPRSYLGDADSQIDAFTKERLS
ncbi:lyase family protein [Herbiconiux sp. KACC 21604]|uniref:lyase family protein n=1 Tax=unclassified Herbiconiux TaxID=2618217 RepID=UPI0014910D12|nr:lyase family protein [Herbiconiux sp. SALV-R1]QJU55658.1 adenylosuccinate lyase [Herbiconiux sp. SALV-R1]WPO86858.1 lyase family protein [Herbiconiux sp. KACC 21604]